MQAALDTMLISEGIYLSDRLGHEVSREDVLAMSQPGRAGRSGREASRPLPGRSQLAPILPVTGE